VEAIRNGEYVGLDIVVWEHENRFAAALQIEFAWDMHIYLEL